jgi:hypothetical protein
VIKALVSTADDNEHNRFSGYFVFATLPRVGDELFVQSDGRRWNVEVKWVRHFAIPENEGDWDGGEPILGCRTIEVFDIND